MASLSVVMPCYNEHEQIYENLLLTASVLDGSGYNYEIIAVNDGSMDSTLEEILRASKECPCIRVVSYPKNRGKGFAVTEGFRSSEGETVIFFDSDLEIHPRYISRILEVFRKTGVDVVVASTNLQGSS
jgi:dolichol-phosphate mannosyltransferase